MSSACPSCFHEANPGNQCPPENTLLHYFTEIVINDNLTIPEQKPDIENIINVNKDFSLDDIEILTVNLGDVTGQKIIVAGTLTLGLEYSAAVPSQQVHYAHFKVPFKAMIKYRPCPGAYRGLIPPDFSVNPACIRVCVEHEQYHVISPREISKVLVVLVWLDETCPQVVCP